MALPPSLFEKSYPPWVNLSLKIIKIKKKIVTSLQNNKKVK